MRICISPTAGAGARSLMRLDAHHREERAQRTMDSGKLTGSVTWNGCAYLPGKTEPPPYEASGTSSSSSRRRAYAW